MTMSKAVIRKRFDASTFCTHKLAVEFHQIPRNNPMDGIVLG